MSLRAYAKHRGCSVEAVSRAVQRRRLRESVVMVDGLPRIRDAKLADKEWRLNTNSAKRPRRTRSNPRIVSRRSEASVLARARVASLDEAQRSLMKERQRKLKIDNDIRDGHLVEKTKVAQEAFTSARTIQKAVLAIPSRLSAEIAADSDAARVYSKLAAALREALTAAADQLMAEAEAK
jgi:hypothetical protein